MVIGAFPAAKLGILAIKQISKPIANVIKANAKSSRFFRTYICMPPAQFYNWVEVKTKMWMLNLGRPVSVPPLTESMAIELGSDLLGEFIIFTIGASLVIFEYSRQASKENKKQEMLRQEKEELVHTIAEMQFRLERQDAQIREMTRALADIDSRSLFRWNKANIQEYEAFNPDEPDQNAAARLKNSYEGLYDPNVGFLYRALNYLETQIFADKPEKHAKNSFDEIDDVEESIESSFGESTHTIVGNAITSINPDYKK